jgi:hypothetical protein
MIVDLAIKSANNKCPVDIAMEDPLLNWWIYLSWRSRAAIRAYDKAFSKDGTFHSTDPYAQLIDVHAFFTHAAMVARAFLPSPKGASARTKSRAAALRTRIGIQEKPFKDCLNARNNLDHYDERIDAIEAIPGGIVAPVSYQARTQEDLKRLGEKRSALMLVYLKDEHALVTYAPNGDRIVTKIEPIHRELCYVLTRSTDFMERRQG